MSKYGESIGIDDVFKKKKKTIYLTVTKYHRLAVK